MSRDCFTPYDWSRSYLLPADVASNIELRGSVGMVGAHNAARGLLVETCRHTGAHPTGLRYAETVLGDGAIIVVVAAVPGAGLHASGPVALLAGLDLHPVSLGEHLEVAQLVPRVGTALLLVLLLGLVVAHIVEPEHGAQQEDDEDHDGDGVARLSLRIAMHHRTSRPCHRPSAAPDVEADQ